MKYPGKSTPKQSEKQHHLAPRLAADPDDGPVPVDVVEILSTLYDTFEPAEASRLARRFEFHCTPKHGGWLNMAEIEINVLSLQCLDRRIPDRETMVSEVAAWQEHRNASAKPVNWRFRTEDTRIKLKSLYPSIQ